MSPSIALRSDDLPEPTCPMTQMNSPLKILRSICLSWMLSMSVLLLESDEPDEVPLVLRLASMSSLSSNC